MHTQSKKHFLTLTVTILLLISGRAAALLPFEKTGNLYVSMWQADEIAVFTPDGTELERFTADGLNGPRGIAFNPVNGEIWIAGEFSDAIFIFDHQHQLLRTLEHEDFDEPVGVTFRTTDTGSADPLVYISNSNGNEIMVFDQSGVLQRRFTAPDLSDPNCSAFMADGSLMVSNRLGGSNGAFGSISKFDSQDNFLLDFSAAGIASLMAVARDPNIPAMIADDTLWATSGSGDTGIYEFDLEGNLLNTLLPAAIDDGRAIVPQGIAFDDAGDFYVISFLNEVLKFDSDGNFILRFPTGSGTSRSTAFQGCNPDIGDRCVPLGVADMTLDSNVASTNTDPIDSVTTDTTSESLDSSSGGGAFSLFAVTMLTITRRRLQKLRRVS